MTSQEPRYAPLHNVSRYQAIPAVAMQGMVGKKHVRSDAARFERKTRAILAQPRRAETLPIESAHRRRPGGIRPARRRIEAFRRGCRQGGQQGKRQPKTADYKVRLTLIQNTADGTLVFAVARNRITMRQSQAREWSTWREGGVCRGHSDQDIPPRHLNRMTAAGNLVQHFPHARNQGDEHDEKPGCRCTGRNVHRKILRAGQNRSITDALYESKSQKSLDNGAMEPLDSNKSCRRRATEVRLPHLHGQ